MKTMIVSLGQYLSTFFVRRAEDTKEYSLKWRVAYAAWEKAAEDWRKEFIPIAENFRKETGRGLNLGLIYTSQLEGGPYGGGLPLFWNSDYWKDGMVADEIIVKKGDTCHVSSIEQLRENTAILLRVRPAQYVNSLNS